MIDDLIKFYDYLSYNVWTFMSNGVKITFPINFESLIFSSLSGTLDSIKLVLEKGHINDVYALLRKYDDGILINLYIDCYIYKKQSFENFIVEKVNNWIHGRERLPNSTKMITYIRSYNYLTDLNTLIDFDGVYKKMRQRCNDNAHLNSIYYMVLNDSSVYLDSRVKELNQFESFLRNFFIFHFIYLFTLHQEYMSSSDYEDAVDYDDRSVKLEIGLEYEVAPFVQDIFDKYVKPYRNDLANYLKEHICMKLN